ncbi:hypothetical protein PC9H_005698 [Pleurotus ostreatus]|uniref:Secreted protein n=1 Tax=Pleurotus ostreatus TaxID=5322 RepID=A0A8H7DXA2_PLEOS|nr:uncharacterized protein PC9H_005698 [Pleurotus ostreatus]KAF7433733.1 hypothetical protein PC9H_005698 [Pleurotus ostreatus]
MVTGHLFLGLLTATNAENRVDGCLHCSAPAILGVLDVPTAYVAVWPGDRMRFQGRRREGRISREDKPRALKSASNPSKVEKLVYDHSAQLTSSSVNMRLLAIVSTALSILASSDVLSAAVEAATEHSAPLIQVMVVGGRSITISTVPVSIARLSIFPATDARNGTSKPQTALTKRAVGNGCEVGCGGNGGRTVY